MTSDNAGKKVRLAERTQLLAALGLDRFLIFRRKRLGHLQAEQQELSRIEAFGVRPVEPPEHGVELRLVAKAFGFELLGGLAFDLLDLRIALSNVRLTRGDLRIALGQGGRLAPRLTLHRFDLLVTPEQGHVALGDGRVAPGDDRLEHSRIVGKIENRRVVHDARSDITSNPRAPGKNREKSAKMQIFFGCCPSRYPAVILQPDSSFTNSALEMATDLSTPLTPGLPAAAGN